jgi:hypothetical protein
VFRKPLIKLLLLVSLIGSLFTIPSSVVASSDRAQATQQEIRKVAAYHVAGESKMDGSKWKDKLQLGKEVPVYDDDDSVIAHIVEVTSNGQPSGWIMVSTSLDEDPIIMWSDGGTLPTPDRLQANLGETANNIRSSKLMWHGGTNLGASFELNDGTKWIIGDSGEKVRSTGKAWHHVTRNENARGFWSRILMGSPGQTNPADGVTDINPDTWESGYAFITKNYLSSTDGINQAQWIYSGSNWTGCAPTAASNIMVYWAKNGYPALNSYNDQQRVVMDLRGTMQTYQDSSGTGVTNPTKIGPGMQTYANNQGYWQSKAYNLYLISYANMYGEIDAGRPFLLNTSGNSYFGGGHTVWVVGYKQYTFVGYPYEHDYLVFRNNWGDSTYNLYIKYGAWSTVSMSTFHPGG